MPINYRVSLLFITLLGFGLRVLYLDQQSLWYDEGISWLMVQHESLAGLIRWTADDIQPPAYYLLLWFTSRLFGTSEYALRFPSVLFGTLIIPLIASLTRQIIRPQEKLGSSTSLLAALLCAISPILLYYSQEARMYSLLVFEACLSSYLLLRLLISSEKELDLTGTSFVLENLSDMESALRLISGKAERLDLTSLGVAYMLVSLLALYTHYFAVFLLIAQGFYVLMFVLMQIQRNSQEKRTLLEGLDDQKYLVHVGLAWLGIVTLFAPWLTVMLARLGDDPSYWSGALKLNEIVRKIGISFAVGETVVEAVGFWLMLGHLALIGLAILDRRFWNWYTNLKSKIQNRQSETHAPFLILWLIIPLVGILWLTTQSPKFNSRYTLIVWPPFVILLAHGLNRLGGWKKTQFSRQGAETQRNRFIRKLGPMLFAVAALFVVSSSLYSLNNWFTDRRFAKDDFRALAQFVKERAADDETVLLSSGHMFPVWAYYSGWQGWTPLPDMARLDVNQVTTLDIAEEMYPALQDAGGVWLVSWQDEVIDPNHVVPFWLDQIGERPHDAGDFWGVRLEHWRLEDTERLTESPIEHAIDLNVNQQVKLLGLTQLNDAELLLFWQALQPLDDTLIYKLHLTDADGFDWERQSLSGQLGSATYPPSRWPVGETIITRHALPWQLGAPPGLYQAELELGQTVDGQYQGWDILDEQGRPERRTALLSPVNLSRLIEPETGWLPMQNPLIDFSPIISLRKIIMPQTSAEPGDRLLLALLWQAGDFNLDDISLRFALIDAAQKSHTVSHALTPSRRFNLSRWRPNQVVLGQYWLDIPPDTADGLAQLQVHLVNEHGFVYDERFPLTEIEILPTERNFTPPDQLDLPIQADFSGQATLLGLTCNPACPGQADLGDTVSLTFYWRADSRMETAYTIFAHLLDETEQVIVNADHAPPKSSRAWVTGEIINDEITLTIPADTHPALFEIGLYDSNDPAFTRLPLTDGANRVLIPWAEMKP
ncbi:glycosyltransferase family 39 protein [Anaerolineales bacterium HSG25]|nr:glycosyltransferase family 39 protein [Anaerolineales bacterium HSG25]